MLATVYEGRCKSRLRFLGRTWSSLVIKCRERERREQKCQERLKKRTLLLQKGGSVLKKGEHLIGRCSPCSFQLFVGQSQQCFFEHGCSCHTVFNRCEFLWGMTNAFYTLHKEHCRFLYIAADNHRVVSSPADERLA